MRGNTQMQRATFTAVAIIGLTVSNGLAANMGRPRARHFREDPFAPRQRFVRRGRFGRNNDRRPMTMPLRMQRWGTVSHAAQQPSDICSAVKQRVKYAHDNVPADEWKAAKETWDTGRGDCEDFAVVVKRLCERQDIKADVYRFYPPKGQGHAVTIGEHQGLLWMSSNGSYVEVHSIEAAKWIVANKHGWQADLVRTVKGEKSRQRETAAW